MMVTVSRNQSWKVLGDRVRAAREELGMTSRAQLAEAAGVAEGTVQRMETGNLTRLPNRVAAIERALGWAPGTARRLVEGEEPFAAEPALQMPPPPVITQEQKDKFRELVLRSKVLSAAARAQMLAEIDETPTS